MISTNQSTVSGRISTNERAPLWAEMFSSLSSIKTSFITASDVFAEPQVVLDREIGECSDDIWSLTLVQTLYQFSVLKAEGRLLPYHLAPGQRNIFFCPAGNVTDQKSLGCLCWKSGHYTDRQAGPLSLVEDCRDTAI